MAKTNTQKTKAPEMDAPTRAGYEVKVRIDHVVDYENRSMPGSCTYAVGDTTQDGCVELHGILEREEQPDDL